MTNIKPLKRIVIKEELVELTGDFRPAIILNQFIYWIEKMRDTDKYIQAERERASKENMEVSIDESNGWIYKSSKELNEELMVNMSDPTIRKYIKQLVEMGLLQERKNPKYKWDKKTQYRVNLYKIQVELAKLGYTLEGYALLPGVAEYFPTVEQEESMEDTTEEPRDITEEPQDTAEKPRDIIEESMENIDIDNEEKTGLDRSIRYAMNDIVHTEEYKQVFDLKLQTNPSFKNMNPSTQNMIVAQELNKQGFNIALV